jgi:hypothetical protein
MTNPVLDTIAQMTAASLVNFTGSPEELVLIRIAALAAVDAPEASYLLHIGPAAEAGVTLEDVSNVLVAIAPIVGTARIASAAGKISDALDLAIAVVAAEELAGE